MLFEKLIEKNPDAIALNDTLNTRSWSELQNNVLTLKHYFEKDMGLKPNDHLAILMGNRVEFFEAMLAGIVSGLWVTPVNTHLSAEEVDYIVSDCGASLCIHDAQHKHLLQNPGCKTRELESLLENLPNNASSLNEKSISGGTMIYTSGTTGRPKGVKRNKPEFLSEALSAMRKGAKSFGLSGAGPHLVTGPLYHAAPMLFAMYDLLNGAPVIIMPKWNNEQFLHLLEKYHVHTTHLVPTMFVRLLQLSEMQAIPSRCFSSLKLVLHGAAPIAPNVKKRMIEWWGPILTEYWGASEAGTSTLVHSEEWLKHPGTVGKALPHLEIFIGDENGKPIEADTGLLFCRHQNLKQVFEYHNAPEKTAEAHPAPYTFCIGDIGHIDQEGYVYLSDRKSNMIISGGVNIYPAEIEQALIEHPLIADLAVFGVADEEWGESVKALIELKNKNSGSHQAIIEDIQTFARNKIAAYKVPRIIEFTENLPRNAAGKIPKALLK